VRDERYNSGMGQMCECKVRYESQIWECEKKVMWR